MARDAYVIGPMTTGFFAFAPVGECLVWLWLVVAAEMAVILVLHREYQQGRQTALVALQDEMLLALLRRIVPQLRSRRPLAVIEAQQRWWQAAARRRAQVQWRKAS
jgi:hypothetical protein